MTKMSKIKIHARRTSKAASGAVKNALRRLSHAQLEAQVAELEEQIALLKEEGIGKFSQGNREEVKTESLSPLEKSPLEKGPLEKSPIPCFWLRPGRAGAFLGNSGIFPLIFCRFFRRVPRCRLMKF